MLSTADIVAADRRSPSIDVDARVSLDDLGQGTIALVDDGEHQAARTRRRAARSTVTVADDRGRPADLKVVALLELVDRRRLRSATSSTPRPSTGSSATPPRRSPSSTSQSGAQSDDQGRDRERLPTAARHHR